MANRVLVELSYNKKVLIDVADLPKLMEILNGATIVDYNYVGDERIDYVKDEAYCLQLSDTGNRLYKTEEQFDELKAQYEAAQEPAEDAA